ncbi:MAG: hypothetical protein JNM51_00775, partial [Bacteroidia bacterium]|nr:hypothetical protein [Bacteroidia bacterium]
MKSILRYFFLFIICLTTSIFTKVSAQNNTGSSWLKKFEYQKAFIENRGQFSIPNSFGNPSEVLYAVDHGG